MAELSAEMREHRSASNEAGGGISQLRELLLGVTEPIRAVRANLGELAEAFAGAFAIEQISEWFSSVTEGAEKVERASHELGASSTAVQQIGAIAKLTGTEFDEMSAHLERMQLGLARTSSSTAPARAALAALGIEAENFRQLPIPEQLEMLAAAFEKFADGPTKTAAAMALLGRAGAELIPYLDRGKEGLEELKKAAQETGVVMSEDDVKALAETQEASNKLSLAVKALGQDIAIGLNGPITKAIDLLTKLSR